MQEYFTEKDFVDAKKLKRNAIIIFLIALGVYLLFSAGMIVWYVLQPYKSPTLGTVKWVHYSVTAVFVILAFLYLGIPYRRIKKYYKVVFNMQNANREEYTARFIEYDDTVEQRDGVDYKSLIFLQYNMYKKDFFERKVLVFADRPMPEIQEEANVKFITQSNVLIKYEIIE